MITSKHGYVGTGKCVKYAPFTKLTLSEASS